MDGLRFDRMTQGLASRLSRRRAALAFVGGSVAAALGMVGPDDAAAATCKRPQERCRRRSQCCRSKAFRCGFSHGGGSKIRTCCGEPGAPCQGTALGCCIPLMCGPNNRCVEP